MKSGSHPSDLTQQENRGAVSKKWQQFILFLTMIAKLHLKTQLGNFVYLSSLQSVLSSQENSLSLQTRQLVSESSLQSVQVFDSHENTCRFCTRHMMMMIKNFCISNIDL